MPHAGHACRASQPRSCWKWRFESSSRRSLKLYKKNKISWSGIIITSRLDDVKAKKQPTILKSDGPENKHGTGYGCFLVSMLKGLSIGRASKQFRWVEQVFRDNFRYNLGPEVWKTVETLPVSYMQPWKLITSPACNWSASHELQSATTRIPNELPSKQPNIWGNSKSILLQNLWQSLIVYF